MVTKVAECFELNYLLVDYGHYIISCFDYAI